MERSEMIKKMLAAGLDLDTALDIALSGQPAAAPAEAAADPEPAPAAADPEPEAPAPSVPEDHSAQLLEAITKLTAAVQRSNILTLGADDAQENQQDAVDKLLTRILSGKEA